MEIVLGTGERVRVIFRPVDMIKLQGQFSSLKPDKEGSSEESL